MSPATHGWWCGTKTYLTTCRSCSRRVFFFSCNCGCAVFFDSLGDPWPIHECVWTPPPWLGFRRTPDPPRLDPGYAARISARGRGAEWKIDIVRTLPLTEEPLSVCGILREICEGVDPARSLGFDRPGAMARSVLRAAGLVRVSQVTIHVENSADDTIESYTGFISRDLLARLRPKRGDLVGVKLGPRSPMGRGPVWLVEDLAFL